MKDGQDNEALFKNKQVTEDVKRRVLAEKKAHDTVKELLEEGISENTFTHSVYFLTVDHYQDVVEERAILALCGYPTCDNALKKIPKQQYHISGNKVYDLTERKNFCSNLCYRLSNHVKNQILSSPLWLRDPENVIPVPLVNSGPGLKGDEVHIRHVITNKDISNNSEINEKTDLSDESIERKVRFSDETSDVTEETSHQPASLATKRMTNFSEKSRKSPESTEIFLKQQFKLIIERLMEILKDWITRDSLNYLGYCSSEPQEEPDNIYIDDEERIKMKRELLEERLINAIQGDNSTAQSKPFAASSVDGTSVYAERVERFYKGKLEYRRTTPQKKQEKPTEKVTSGGDKIIYPHVDSKNQTVIRRKILHQKFYRVMQEIAPTLPSSVTSHDLKHLIATFRLSSTNILFKTNEYPIMAVLLLQLMSNCNSDVKSTLLNSQLVLNHILSPFQLNLSSLKESIGDIIKTIMTSV